VVDDAAGLAGGYSPRISPADHSCSEAPIWRLPCPRQDVLLLGIDVQRLLADLAAAAAQQDQAAAVAAASAADGGAGGGGGGASSRRSSQAGGSGAGAASAAARASAAAAAARLQLVALTALSLLHRWGLDAGVDGALAELLAAHGLLDAATTAAAARWGAGGRGLSMSPAGSSGALDEPTSAPADLSAGGSCSALALAQEAALSRAGAAAALGAPSRLPPPPIDPPSALAGPGQQQQGEGQDLAWDAVPGALFAGDPGSQAWRLLALVALARWLMGAGAGAAAPAAPLAALGSSLATLYVVTLRQRALGLVAPDLLVLGGAWAAGAGVPGREHWVDAASTLLGALLQPTPGPAGPSWPQQVMHLVAAARQLPLTPGPRPHHQAQALAQLLPQLVVSAAACVAHPQAVPRTLLACAGGCLAEVVLAAAPAPPSLLAASLLAQALTGAQAGLWLLHLGQTTALLARWEGGWGLGAACVTRTTGPGPGPGQGCMWGCSLLVSEDVGR
jgi:hypothetical protein